MKLAILTTETPHHCMFVDRLLDRVDALKVFSETEGVRATFETSHAFEVDRDEYERELWFDTKMPTLMDLAPTTYGPNINALCPEILNFGPDLTIVFGTRRLKPQVLEACGHHRILNLHGGDPELYRGLDSHLWAIYHEEFGHLKTCLHSVNEELDDGKIYGMHELKIRRGMKLLELRAENTDVCVDLARTAISDFVNGRKTSLIPQKQKGRYYSFMPSVLKELCVKKFERYTNGLE